MATLAEIVAKDTIQYFDCVAIELGTGYDYYLTQAPYNLTLLDGNTYISAGGLLAITSFSDAANMAIEKLQVNISGIVSLPGSSNTVLQQIQTMEYIDKPLTIHRAFMENFAVAHERVLYKGYISNISGALGASGDNTQAGIETSSHWIDFDRVSTRYTNNNTQQEHFPNDDGFSFSKQVQKEVQWREQI